jgi:predicted peptidase
MGECGTDGQRHLDVGLGPAIRAEPDRWPFVVVFPQKPDRQSQWAEHEPMVMAMLAATEKEYSIDPSRRFLTGLSQGGAGTWALGSKHADLWAALAPICGYGDPAAIAPKLTSMPILAFHGLDDPTVPPQQSKDLVAAVVAAGGSAELTEYPGVGHNSWDKAYRESPLAEWLQQQGARAPR